MLLLVLKFLYVNVNINLIFLRNPTIAFIPKNVAFRSTKALEGKDDKKQVNLQEG